MKNQPLPAVVQEQIDRFYRDYPLKKAEDLSERYQRLVLSEDYRSASLGRTENPIVEHSRPRVRARASNKKMKPL